MSGRLHLVSDKKSDTELWKRFSSSRNKFDKRRRSHFAQLEAESAIVVARKQAIIDEAVKLATSKEWLTTANRFKALMAEWKAAGRGKRSVDVKMWEKFKAAQDQFFAAKNADLEKRQGTMAENLKKREELILQIESLSPVHGSPRCSKGFPGTLGKMVKDWNDRTQ
jgi:hypothetical protein